MALGSGCTRGVLTPVVFDPPVDGVDGPLGKGRRDADLRKARACSLDEREGSVSLAGIQADDKKLATSVVVRTSKGAERVGLQPDLLVVIRRDRGNVALVVEVDRGTVSVRTMTAKYAAYAAWKATGGPERDLGLRGVRVVTVVPDERRLKKLHDAALAATHAKRSGFFLFALQDRFSAGAASALLEPIARVTAPGDPAHVPLVEAA